MTDRAWAYEHRGHHDVLYPSKRVASAVRSFTDTHIGPRLRTLWELAKSTGRIFSSAGNQCAFRCFWGPAILTSDAYFVMDSYDNVRLRSGLRSMGGFEATQLAQISASSDPIHGTFSPQAAAMLTALFLQHTGKVLRIATDTEMGDKMDATLVCYGTSDSNFKTFDIEVASQSDLCQFSFNGNGERSFCLGGQHYFIESRQGVTYDKAIFMRLCSSQTPQHCHVICAGLSEWGSLAAVHYLTKKWKSLHQRFDHFGQRQDFCVLLEVPCGQFEHAREIASAVRWAPRTARSLNRNRVPASAPER